jgi:methyl-accepting chemotaxis protein
VKKDIMKLRNFRIGTRLGLGFSVVLTMLVVMTVAGHVMNANSRENLIEGMRTANIKQVLANTMRAALLESAVEMRNISLQQDVQAMQANEANVRTQLKRYEEARARLEALGLRDAEKKIVSNIARIEKEIDAPFAEAMGLALAFDNEGAGKILATRVDQRHRQALTELNKLIEQQEAAVRTTIDQDAAVGKRLMMALSALCLLAVALGGASAWLITRSITHPLRSAVAAAQEVAAGDLATQLDVQGKDEVTELLQALKYMSESLRNIVSEVRSGTEIIAAASQQLASGNADLSSRTEKQASSLEQTASATEELTSTVKTNADNARQANQMAIVASEVATKGGAVVSEVVGTMGAINESAKKIVDIIGVIDGIAFQTNILALNAAVEAARAGEQGRGFAVVASEVRSLAQRSANAAKEIKTLIDDSVEKVDAGSMQVNKAGATMQEVVTAIRRVTDLMGEISAASQEQTAGIEQVQQAVTQMDQTTQQNAALVEEAAAAADALQDQAGTLAQVVGVFKLGNASEAAVMAPAKPNGKVIAMTTKVTVGARASAGPRQVRRLTSGGTGTGGDWEEF